MTWPPSMKLVSVLWIDSCGHNGWRDYDTMLATVQDSLACRSVGYLLFESTDRISLVQSLSKMGSVAAAMTIPRIAIISITEIAPASDVMLASDGMLAAEEEA